MKDTTVILLATAAAFVVCTLGIVIAPTTMAQVFFGVIDLFIITLFVFVSCEVINDKVS
jgi:bacteriorhodopsin